jgi:hypothetical protein
MSLSPDQYYVIGEPYNYTSIYGYPKRRFPVHRADELGNKLDSYSVGEIKEEPMLDENGQLWGRCFYTKSLRPSGKYRFYPSPEALIVACGGKVLSKPAAEHPIKGDVQEKAFEKLLNTPETDEDGPGVDSPNKASPIEERLSKLEAKIDALAAKPRNKAATSRRAPAKVSRSKAKTKTPARKKKVTS